MPAAPFTTTFLYLTGGLSIWALRFVSVYSFTAIACSRGWDTAGAGPGLIPIGVISMSVAAVLGCLLILAAAARRLRIAAVEADESRRFLHYVAATVAALALLAIVWETLPLFMVPACR